MSEASFTPGPWECERCFRDEFSHDAGHYTVENGYLTIFFSGPPETIDEAFDGRSCAEVYGNNQEANARLIAAAPDLYGALQGLLVMAEDLAATFPIKATDDGLTVLDAARAALAKANTPPQTQAGEENT